MARRRWRPLPSSWPNTRCNIDDAKVMFTLIKAPADGPFGKRVTKARNHQNPVQTANFASLDENQERLRQEVALLGVTYHYRPEALATDSQSISLDEALRALASQQGDPRYTVWLKSEPARLTNPESAEYQALFPATLTGVAMVNAVLCHNAIRTLVVSYEQRAARSQEKLIYRHAIHVITAVMMKRLRQRIGAAAVIDAAAIPGLISQPLDELRQQTFDLKQQQVLGEGPLAYFRNQGSVVSFMADLMATHFGLTADPTLPTLRNINTAADAYPRKRLLDYLSGKAPNYESDAMSKQKLELTWIGKEKRPKLEPRILREEPDKSYHAKQRVTENDIFDNRLIFGDNLLALKALEAEFAGKVKCVFIDPPYNTGSAFKQYDDGLEHSIWLGLMRDRLEIIRRLLADDGSLWITIDDNEAQYLKVLCDEVFGRACFVTTFIWKR